MSAHDQFSLPIRPTCFRVLILLLVQVDVVEMVKLRAPAENEQPIR